MKNILKMTLIFVVLATMLNNNAYAQFGKNKVQYEKFDWKYIESEHFNVFYNKGSNKLAEFAAVEAEKALVSIQRTLNYRLSMKIVLAVYDSHNQFQQTNLISSFMTEGVGGVTELFKNRVVVPFQGDYAQLRHVIHHELVHAVMNDMFYGGNIQSVLSGSAANLPLWMAEGMAEYESQGGMDVDNDVYMRDMVISKQLPPIQDLDGYNAYRGGQTLFWYISDKYGPEKVTELIKTFKMMKNVDQTFSQVFRMKLRDFSEQWQADIEKIYFPDVKTFDSPRDFSQKITDRRDIGNFTNSSPAVSPDGNKIAFISDRDGLYAIYVMDLDKKDKVEKIVSSYHAQDFEDLNILTPGITWDPTGKKIAISAKAGGQDAIFVWDTKEEDYDKLTFGLKSISSVQWSPDGKYFVFVASQIEKSDLYLYDIKAKKLQKLTNDPYADLHPAWSPDSKSVYFVSDRLDKINNIDSTIHMWEHDYKSSDIYKIDIQSKEITRLTFDPAFVKTSIAPSVDGKHLFFISDKNGIGNIYKYDLEKNTIVPVTNSAADITQLSLANDNNALYFVAQKDGGYDIFKLTNPLEKKIEGELPLTTFRKSKLEQNKLADELLNKSSNTSQTDTSSQISGYGDFSIDFANQAVVEPNIDVTKVSNNNNSAGTTQSNFQENNYKIDISVDMLMVNPSFGYYGAQGSGFAVFSDKMGDHQFVIQGNLNRTIQYSDINLAYTYKPEPIDYTVALFNNGFYYFSGTSNWYRFGTYGLSGLASYPTSLFSRFELGTSFTLAYKEAVFAVDDVSEKQNKSFFMFTPELRYVFDNSMGWLFAPTRGTRMNIELLGSPKFSSSSLGFITMKTDIRQYLPITDYIGFAFRGAGGASFGQNKQKFIIGGTENWINMQYSNKFSMANTEDYVFLSNITTPMRGWGIGEAMGSKYFVANAELRFPIFLALPIQLISTGIMCNFFVDAGGFWDDKFVISQKDLLGRRYPMNLFVSTGTGIRTYFNGLPIKVDVAWTDLYTKWSAPYWMFSLGYDF